ncbi:hypothetical protein OPV22_027868 [Ensete ventricosum]|uniref:Hikeshi-like N-terminal domain-containing protein n=1 Tax=Ensete ventricosum TaxID=4639 RepID=A0AAV8P4K6_ENSVE|nr:hypothetical protein OPV22_027868 [Ensete ventricosum]
MFGVVFPERSYPMDASAFAQIDPLHWVLDMASFVGDAYRDVKEVCVFLLPAAAASFPPGKALAVYVQPPGHPFLFCGAVHPARPSAVLALPWPDLAEDAVAAVGALQVAGASAKIGVSVEDLASLPTVADAGAEKRAERLALKVGENLFNFMQSGRRRTPATLKTSLCESKGYLIINTTLVHMWKDIKNISPSIAKVIFSCWVSLTNAIPVSTLSKTSVL